MYQLRDYQENASNAGVEYFLEKKKRSKSNNGVIVAPTGAGKSLIIASIAHKLGRPILIFQPRKELVIQNYEKYVSYGNSANIYSASAGRKDIGDVTFATIGSVVKNPEKFKHFDYCIVDECHTLPPNETSMYQKFLSQIDAKILGLTATPIRLKQYNFPEKHSKLNMLDRMRPRVFGEYVHITQIQEMVDREYFAQTEYQEISFDRSKLKINTTGGDFTEESMTLALEKQGTNDKIVETIKKLREYGRKHIVVFVPSVAEAQYIAYHGGGAAIHAQTNKKRRDSVLKRFKSGDIPFVANVGILGIGFDFPALDTILIARPTMSLAMQYQWCIDENTEILTDRGWINIDNIDYNDIVASVNIQAKKPSILWEKPLDIIKRKVCYKEKMISIQSPTIDMRFIDNHDMIVAYRKNKRGVEWKKEKAIDTAKRKDSYYIPISAFENVEKELPLYDDEIKFIGWFLTDGSIGKYRKTIRISQSSKQHHFYEIEKMLNGCNFKYGKFKIKSKTQFNENGDRYMYYVSYGNPKNKKDKRTGWSHLERYIDKNFSLELNGLSRRQLHILLETVHYGDGTKQFGQSWTGRSYHITTINEKFANRLQSLCVRRGFKCNIGYDKTPRGKKLFRLHIKDVFTKMIGGQNQNDRKSLIIDKPNKEERVWSVTVPSGNFIARRNGKVFITGNCGRGVRPHPDKDKCLIIDFVGNYRKFGRVEDLEIRKGQHGWGIYSNGVLLTNRDVTVDGDVYKEKQTSKKSGKILDEQTIGFGKHSGEKLRELPKDYLHWIWKNVESKSWTKNVIDYIKKHNIFEQKERLIDKKEEVNI